MIFEFVAPQGSPFQFSPTLDGETYNVTLTWNAFGQRYYLDLYQQNGQRVATVALFGSPIGVSVQSIRWAHERVTMKTVTPHNHSIGATIDLTVAGCSPTAYNGRRRVLITKMDEFSFALSGNPGAATVFGTANYNANIFAGYFNTSVLLYRSASRQFEVLP